MDQIPHNNEPQQEAQEQQSSLLQEIPESLHEVYQLMAAFS
jgi:hypothetical protein